MKTCITEDYTVRLNWGTCVLFQGNKRYFNIYKNVNGYYLKKEVTKYCAYVVL